MPRADGKAVLYRACSGGGVYVDGSVWEYEVSRCVPLVTRALMQDPEDVVTILTAVFTVEEVEALADRGEVAGHTAARL